MMGKKYLQNKKKKKKYSILHSTLIRIKTELSMDCPPFFRHKWSINLPSSILCRFCSSIRLQPDKSFSCHLVLWHEIIGLSFKQHTRSTSAWIFHEFNARFLEARCYISHRQNILNPDIHEVVYYLLYFSSNLCKAYGRATCNLSLAQGPYKN